VREGDFMANAESTVERFMKCPEIGDFQSLRGLLKDDFSFKGPFDSFEEPGPFLAALQKLHPVIARIDVKRMFVDGDDVCVLYDMLTNTSAGTAFIVEWHQVKGDKIGAITAVLDARPFAPMFAQ
jgi:hypothetical protein